MLTWLPTYLVCHGVCVYLGTHVRDLSSGSVLSWLPTYLVCHLPGYPLTWFVTGDLCLPGYPLNWFVTGGVCAYLVIHLPGLSQGSALTWFVTGVLCLPGYPLTWLPTYLFGTGGLCLPGYPLTWFVTVPVLASCRVALCSETTWSPTAC